MAMPPIAVLDISGTAITGRIPPSLATALETLILNSNQLSGPIPPELASLAPTLRNLFLIDNGLSSELPPSSGDLRLLESLRERGQPRPRGPDTGLLLQAVRPRRARARLVFALAHMWPRRCFHSGRMGALCLRVHRSRCHIKCEMMLCSMSHYGILAG